MLLLLNAKSNRLLGMRLETKPEESHSIVTILRINSRQGEFFTFPPSIFVPFRRKLQNVCG